MDDPTDDGRPDEYLSDAELVDRLRREVALLRTRLAALEQQVKQFDLGKLREELAVLKARVDLLTDDRAATGARIGRLTALTLCVLAVAAANLTATLMAAWKP